MVFKGLHTDGHQPVMISQVMQTLSPHADATYIDATFGRGGYARAFLDATTCRVIAFDRDPEAMTVAREFEKNYKNRFNCVERPFSELDQGLNDLGVTQVDGIVFDLGVSSPQLDSPVRGFSFQNDGPLDMRMSLEGETAADVVNTHSETEIADILWHYGEERHSRRIAKRIVAARLEKPFTRTHELASLVRSVYGGHQKKDPATKTFQALRIYLNDELGELEKGLLHARNFLRPNGRLVVVTFHSLEDRIVKRFLRQYGEKKPTGSRHQPFVAPQNDPEDICFTLVDRKALLPTEREIQQNPRARSAKLRWAIKTIRIDGEGSNQ